MLEFVYALALGLIGTLNREDILGDMFYAGMLGYFGEYLALSQVASGPQNAKHAAERQTRLTLWLRHLRV